MKQLCFEYREGAIKLIQTDFDEFTVQYGLQVEPGLTYEKAARRLGAAIMHYAAGEGCLDSRELCEVENGDTEPFYFDLRPCK